MDAFARLAWLKVIWDAFFTALAAAILMFAYSSDPPLAFVLGASVVMFFTGVMLVRALLLTEEKVVASEPWLVMQPDERPVGQAGLAYARERLQTAMLAAAKNGAGVASAMFALGFFLDVG